MISKSHWIDLDFSIGEDEFVVSVYASMDTDHYVEIEDVNVVSVKTNRVIKNCRCLEQIDQSLDGGKLSDQLFEKLSERLADDYADYGDYMYDKMKDAQCE